MLLLRCGGAPGGRFGVRKYVEAPPAAPVRKLYVDPVWGTDAGDRANPFASLIRALGYEYRVALKWLTAPVGTQCPISLTLDFGPDRLLNDTRSGSAARKSGKQCG